MNETKLKAMELAVAASGHNLHHDPKSLVKLAEAIEIYLMGMTKIEYVSTSGTPLGRVADWTGGPAQ